MAAIYLLFGVTLVISVSSGLVCWKKHSPYPEVKTGYHFKPAMSGKEEWEYANVLAGKLALFSGLAAFLLLPSLFLLFGMSVDGLLTAYFILVFVWSMLVIALPVVMLKRKFPTVQKEDKKK